MANAIFNQHNWICRWNVECFWILPPKQEPTTITKRILILSTVSLSYCISPSSPIWDHQATKHKYKMSISILVFKCKLRYDETRKTLLDHSAFGAMIDQFLKGEIMNPLENELCKNNQYGTSELMTRLDNEKKSNDNEIMNYENGPSCWVWTKSKWLAIKEFLRITKLPN